MELLILARFYNLRLYFILLTISFYTLGSHAKSEGGLGLGFGFGKPTYIATLKPAESLGNTSIEYSPNLESSSTLYFNYKNLIFSFSNNNPADSDSINKKGQSKFSEFHFRVYGNAKITEFFFQNYQSVYIKNSAEVNSDYIGSSYSIQREDIGSERWGAQVTFPLDPKYNFANSLDFNQGEVETGDSFFGMLFIDHHRFFSSTPWIPATHSASFPASNNFDEGLVVSGGLGLGYAFTLEFGGLFFSSYLGAGYAAQSERFTGQTENAHYTNSVPKILLKPSLGYSGKENYFVVFGEQNSTLYEMKNSENIDFTAMDIKAIYGHTFDGVTIAPFEWLSKTLY